MVSNRIKQIDITRGIAILIVILGHACTPTLCENNIYIYILYLIINTCNMPVFFAVSGYMFGYRNNYTSMTKYIKKKTMSLLVPYICYSVTVYILLLGLTKFPLTKNLVYSMERGNISALSIFKGIINFEYNVDKHLWFLPVLFIISVMFYYFSKIHTRYKICLFIVLSLLCVFFTCLIDIPDMLYKPIYYFSFYEFGILLHNYSLEKIYSNKSLIRLFLLSSVVCEIIYLFVFLFSDNTYGKIISGAFKFLIGFISTIIFFILGHVLKNKNGIQIVQKIGKHSMYYYLLHQPFATSGAALVAYKLTNSTIISILGAFIMGVIFSTLILLFSEIIKKEVVRKEL